MLANQIKIESIESLMALAGIVAKSKCFDGVNSPEEAAARILVGMELGLGPMTSIKEVRVDRGKVILSGSVQAAIIKANADYEVLQLDNEACELAFIDAKGKHLGNHRFSRQDAERAKLLTGRNAHTWAAYMRDMLFNRCISGGGKKYFPHLFSGLGVYTEEEVSSIEINPVEIAPAAPAPAPAQKLTASPGSIAPAKPRPAPVAQPVPAKDLTPPWPMDEPASEVAAPTPDALTPEASTPPEPEIPFITGTQLNTLWQKANASKATKPGFALLLRNYLEMNGQPKGQPLDEITELVRAAIKGKDDGCFLISPDKLQEITTIAGNADLMATWNGLAERQQ
jgi:hypothetical protein